MKVGKLTPVKLREVWQKEEGHFSKWLAENLEHLSDALQMNLEIIGLEQRIEGTGFEIDILCEDDEGNAVIIENQLEQTDHKHLGQILTYLIGMEAETAIWITKEPRQEHANVVNWLNEKTDKSIYLVKIEAFRIGNSEPAPLFKVLCEPTDEIKKFGTGKKILLSEKNSRRKRKAAADTIIVPARADGFERVFLGEQCWFSIRLKSSKIPDLKYIAAYQVAPTSAITHIAEIDSIIVSPEDSTKYKVLFKGPAKAIREIKIGTRSKMQGPAYCEYVKINGAKNLDDLLSNSSYEEEAA